MDGLGGSGRTEDKTASVEYMGGGQREGSDESAWPGSVCFEAMNLANGAVLAATSSEVAVPYVISLYVTVSHDLRGSGLG